MLKKIQSVLNIDINSLDELLVYFKDVLPKRTSGYHQDEIGPIIPEDTPEKANLFLNRVFELGGYTVNASSKLDWYATPNGDLEWNGGFVRHGHLVVMANEYLRTKDDKFAKEIISQMLDYIDNVPVYDPIGKLYLDYKKSTWRPFEAAARVGETWPEVLGKIIQSDAITSNDFAKILLSIHEHLVFIKEHHWKTGNHAVGEVAALGIATIFFSEFNESDHWRNYSVEFLVNMWDELFHKDGYTNEMSGGYHWVAMRSFFAFYEVGKKNGYEKIFPHIYIERLVSASYAELYQEKPDYSIPITNDSSSKSNRKEQLERIYNSFGLEEIKYRLTEGKEGKKPKFTSYFFDESRVGIMRSDWSKKANYLFFDMGRWGENHMNEDQLNIEVSSYGRNVLVNCGRWRYTTSPGSPSWIDKAKYFKSTAAYNSLLIDGYSQVPGDATGFMVVKENYEYAEGVFSEGYGTKNYEMTNEIGAKATSDFTLKDITHKRKIIFVEKSFWIVVDTVKTVEEHEAEIIFHYKEGDLLQKDDAILTQFENSNLILKTIGDNIDSVKIYKGSEEPLRGWHCPYYDQIESAPEVSIKQRGKGIITFNTLIMPIENEINEIPSYKIIDKKHVVEFKNKKYDIEILKKGNCRIEVE